MAVDVATFKARFPEFANADETLVQAALDDAALLCPADPWGDKQDLGVGLQAAQSLALSPFAREMQLVSKDGATVYDERLARLRRVVTLGVRVIGGC